MVQVKIPIPTFEYISSKDGKPKRYKLRSIKRLLTMPEEEFIELFRTMHVPDLEELIDATANYIRFHKLDETVAPNKRICDIINLIPFYQLPTFDFNSININPDLLSNDENSLSATYQESLIRQVIKTYLELAFSLVYDPECFIQSCVQKNGRALAAHSNIKNLSRISKTNNAVVCYEVTLIFATRLHKLGIDARLYEDDGERITIPEDVLSTYGTKHLSVAFQIDGQVYTADPVKTIAYGDITNIKFGEEPLGLSCNSKDSATQDAFMNILGEVYNDLKPSIPLPSDIDFIGDLADYLETCSSIPTVNVRERMKIFFNLINSVSFDEATLYAFIQYLKGRLHIVDNVKIVMVADYTREVGVAKASLIIITNDTKISSDLDKNTYYSFNYDSRLQNITLEEIRRRFSSEAYVAISTNILVDKLNMAGGAAK